MVIGQIGALTNILEALATAVGAGMLLGSFSAGVFGFLAKRIRRLSEAFAVAGGYCGGIVALWFALLDLVARYGF